MSGQDFDINLTAPLGDVVNDGKFYNEYAGSPLSPSLSFLSP